MVQSTLPEHRLDISKELDVARVVRIVYKIGHEVVKRWPKYRAAREALLRSIEDGNIPSKQTMQSQKEEYGEVLKPVANIPAKSKAKKGTPLKE